MTARQAAVLRYLTLGTCLKPGYDRRRIKLGPCAFVLFGRLLLECFESALQAHAAGALEQDNVTLANILLEPDAGFAGTLYELGVNPLCARAFDDLRGEPADADDTVEASHLFTCGPVQCGSFGAEFEHLAGDNETPRGGRLAERFHHGLESARVGVVGVIDEPRAAEFDHAAALLAGTHLLSGLNAGVDVDVAEQTGADRSECIQHVVAADEMEVNIATQLFDGQNKARPV